MAGISQINNDNNKSSKYMYRDNCFIDEVSAELNNKR